MINLNILILIFFSLNSMMRLDAMTMLEEGHDQKFERVHNCVLVLGNRVIDYLRSIAFGKNTSTILTECLIAYQNCDHLIASLKPEDRELNSLWIDELEKNRRLLFGSRNRNSAHRACRP